MPVVLDVQHLKLPRVLPPPGSAEPADVHVRGAWCNLVPSYEGDDVAVMAGDEPPLAIRVRDGGEVANFRPVAERPKLLEDGLGLGG